MIEIDYRQHFAPRIGCTKCGLYLPLPLPMPISALSSLVRDWQFNHAHCKDRT